MAARGACDFDTGINGRDRHLNHTCKSKAVFQVTRVTREGNVESFRRCRLHTETIAKGFANTLDQPDACTYFKAELI